MTTDEPIHPGEHLAEIMSELGITQYRLAKTIGVPPIRINDIVHCRRSVTADTALRIGKALGMSAEFWLNLQRMYDLDVARATTDISGIEPLVEMAVLKASDGGDRVDPEFTGRLAERLRRSRSRLYAHAGEHLPADTDSEAVTARLDAIYSEEPSQVSAPLRAAQARALSDRW